MTGSSVYKKQLRIIQLSLAKELSHGICVSNLASRVGRKLHFSDVQCHKLAIAGFLHDVGKLELEKYIFDCEETPLTIEELKYVRMHAAFSASILKKCGYPDDMVEWVYCHHENCDGSGYPRNLLKDQIPLEAKILRVCDVFAALTTDRPYREAFDVDTAVELMIDEIKNYDMKVFLAFLSVIHEENLDGILDRETTAKQLGQLLRENRDTLDEEAPKD